MQNRYWLGAVCFAALFIGLLAMALAQESAVTSPEEMARMIEKWKAVIDPGDPHKALAPRVGSWNTLTRTWMGGPGAEAVETRGTSEVRWVLGGRFLMEEQKGKSFMPDDKGHIVSVDTEGIGLMGYDNYKKQYTAVWVDSLGTQMLSMRGSRPPQGNRFLLYGTMDEPMLDVHDRMVKYELAVMSNDEQRFTVYDLHAGDDYKVVEIIYTRKAD